MERAPPRRSQGKRRIEMKLIENQAARGVTWSKRREGIYRKASELSTLCGVQIVIILSSIAGKVHSFGSPNVDVVLDRFLNWSNLGNPICYIENNHNPRMNSLNQQLTKVHRQVEQGKPRMECVKKKDGNRCLKLRIENSNEDGLKELRNLMMKMSEDTAFLRREIVIASSEASSSRNGKEVITNYTKYDAIGSPIPNDWLKL